MFFTWKKNLEKKLTGKICGQLQLSFRGLRLTKKVPLHWEGCATCGTIGGIEPFFEVFVTFPAVHLSVSVLLAGEFKIKFQ